MTQEKILEIRQDRHPLQELCIDTYVPNDCRLAGGTNAVEIDSEAGGKLEQLASAIPPTGPNLSGKSVHLKQVALIHLHGAHR